MIFLALLLVATCTIAACDLSRNGRAAPTREDASAGAIQQLAAADLGVEGIVVGTSAKSDVIAKFGQWTKSSYLNTVGGDFLQYPQIGTVVVTLRSSGRVVDLYLIRGSRFATRRGVHVGSPVADVLKAYGQPTSTRESGGRVLLYTFPQDSELQIGFKVANDQVEAIGMGYTPLVWRYE